MTAPDSEASQSPLRLLGDRTFGPYVTANFTSNIGNWFQNVAAGIVVFQITGSSTLVGTVSVVQFLGILTLSPWSGSMADRFDRRKMLLLGQVISASGAVALAIWVFLEGVAGLPGVWPVLAATGVIGLGNAIGISAVNALVPALVERRTLGGAISLFSASYTLARAIGPAIAGTIVAALGAAWAFGINALTFLPLIVVLALIRPRTAQRAAGDRSVRAGFTYVRARRSMLWLVLATLAVGWAGDPVITLTPAYADMFGRGEAFVGLQVTAFGVGAAATVLLVSPLTRRIGSVATTRFGLAIIGLGFAAFAAAPDEAVALIGLLLAGVGFQFGVTNTNSDLQHRLDDHMRGRVMALWSMAFLGSRPIAGLVDGGIADLVSPRIGALTIFVPLLIAWWAMGKVTS